MHMKSVMEKRHVENMLHEEIRLNRQKLARGHGLNQDTATQMKLDETYVGQHRDAVSKAGSLAQLMD